MTVQLRKKKRISAILQEALNALDLDFEKLQPRVDRVFEVGRTEGYTDKEIGRFIRKKMRPYYGKTTMWKIFEQYPDARQKQNRKKVPKSETFKHDDICPKCGKPYKDPEAEIWQFNIEEFRIQNVPKAPREYLETATEHFYAESRKWKKKYEELAGPSKEIQKEKADAISKALSRRLQEKW